MSASSKKPVLTVMPVLLSFSPGFPAAAFDAALHEFRSEQLQDAVPIDAGPDDPPGTRAFALKPGIDARFHDEVHLRARALGAQHRFDVTFYGRPTQLSAHEASVLVTVADRPGMAGPMRQWLADDLSPEAQALLARLPRRRSTAKADKQATQLIAQVIGPKKQKRNVTWKKEGAA